MTFSKEQLSQAFIDVLTERAPVPGGVPDHVFSARFENRMQKLIRRQAAHPWAVSHTLARNLIAAAVIVLLLLAMCMSVSAIRDPIFKFFRRHFEGYDEIVFEMPERTVIEQEYVITDLPEGFFLKEETKSDFSIVRIFENETGGYIQFSQLIVSSDEIAVDNERLGYESMEIDGRGVFVLTAENEILLVWNQEVYVFKIVINCKNASIDDAIRVFRSIKPVI